MFYSLLGRTVWYGLKLFLSIKFGSTSVPKKRLLAGGTLALAGAAALVVLRTRSDDDA